MGNNPSRPSSDSGSAGVGRTSGSGANSLPPRREPRRRDSLQALSSAKAVAVPPTESHTSATAQSTSQHRSKLAQSRQRSKTIDTPERAPDKSQDGSYAKSKKDPSRERSEPTQGTLPVAVPPSQTVPGRYDGDRHTIKPSGPPQESYHIAPAQMQRPPRLPIPIEEEVYTPGSPIISPADLSSALDHDAVEGALPRKTSLLSSTTLGEDDDDDSYHHPTELETPVTKTIPTTIEWKHGGDKVYVTGTFAAWDRKFRLHRGPNPDILSTTVQLSPGTHHIKFIIDGDMKLADDLPTAVDYTNILVNYIEVSADDIPQEEQTKPVDIIQPHPPPGVYPPQVLPPTPEVSVQSTRRHGTDTNQPSEPGSPREYGAEFPEYLNELDQPEESSMYQKAIHEVGSAPPPPTLPLFLGKSILNSTNLMKDDASVLNLPNHTVLNHLATSSIKHGVLATSATTRYKRKYVSTILYKPTHEDS